MSRDLKYELNTAQLSNQTYNYHNLNTKSYVVY